MAATTTSFTACNAVMRLDNNAGTLQDISGNSSSVSMSFDNKIGEYRVFGNQYVQRIQCGKDASVTINGVATTTANEIRDVVESWYFSGSGLRTFQLNMPDESTGSKRYQVETVLKNFQFDGDASAAEPVMYKIELAIAGAVAYTTL